MNGQQRIKQNSALFPNFLKTRLWLIYSIAATVIAVMSFVKLIVTLINMRNIANAVMSIGTILVCIAEIACVTVTAVALWKIYTSAKIQAFQLSNVKIYIKFKQIMSVLSLTGIFSISVLLLIASIMITGASNSSYAALDGLYNTLRSMGLESSSILDFLNGGLAASGPIIIMLIILICGTVIFVYINYYISLIRSLKFIDMLAGAMSGQKTNGMVNPPIYRLYIFGGLEALLGFVGIVVAIIGNASGIFGTLGISSFYDVIYRFALGCYLLVQGMIFNKIMTLFND